MRRPWIVIACAALIVTLAMGVRIGTGAIVASNAVVTADVPPYAVVAGNPGAVKKLRFAQSLVQDLLASRWWDADPRFLFDLDFTQPEAVCRRLAIEGDDLPLDVLPIVHRPHDRLPTNASRGAGPARARCGIR